MHYCVHGIYSDRDIQALWVSSRICFFLLVIHGIFFRAVLMYEQGGCSRFLCLGVVVKATVALPPIAEPFDLLCAPAA